MSGHRLINNTLINIANMVISFVVAYVMTPITLIRLGQENYGIWVFLSIFSVSGYFSLLDFGFQGAAIKYVAEFIAKRDWFKLEHVIHATVVFFSAAGLLGSLLLYVFNVYFLSSVFQLPPQSLGLIQSLINIMAVSFLFSFPLIALSAIIEGAQRYDLLRLVNILTMVLTNIIIVVWLRTSNGLALLTGTVIGNAVVLLLSYFVIVRKILPTIHFWPLRLKTDSFKLLFSLSSKLFITRIIGLIFNNTDKIIIGIFLTIAYQTNYDIINKIHIIVLSLLSIVNSAILPATSELAAHNNIEGLRQLVLRATKYAASLVIPMWLILMILPSQFLTIWVGGSYAFLAPMVMLYCSHFFLTIFVGVSSTMFVGVNRLGPVLKISTWAAAINLVISLATVKILGIAGLILGTAVAYIISSLIYIFVGNKIFQIPNSRFFSETIRPLLPASIAAIIPIVLVRFWIPIDHLWSLLFLVLTAYIMYLVVFFLSALSTAERQIAAIWWKKYIKRLPSQ